jgi:hypothetical protein
MALFRSAGAALSLILAFGGAPAALAAAQAGRPAEDLSGLHAFDFRVGHWVAHHRRMREGPADRESWESYSGAQTWWAVMDGRGNVDDNVFHTPHGDDHGATLRAYDPGTGQWVTWWLDGRDPSGKLDPPMKGRFANGVGTFYANDTLGGKPIQVRCIWSHITATSAHWEQAFSFDAGKTWKTNWITDFTKTG